MNLKTMLWDVYIGCYDVLAKLIPYQTMLADIRRYVSCTGSITNFGVGSANFEYEYMTLYPNATKKMNCYDSSEGMLKQAEKKLKQFANADISLINMNLNNPDISKMEESDEILMQNSLYVLENPELFIKEVVQRVLKEFGIFILVNPRKDQNFFKIFKNHVINNGKITVKMFLQLLGVMIINILIVGKAGTEKYHFYETDDLVNLLSECGFDVLKISETYGNQCDFIISRKRS